MEVEMSTRLAVGLCMTVLSLSALARESLPKDVAQFVEQHEACDHARSDAASHAMQKFCKESDKHLAELKKRYADDPAVMQRLAEFGQVQPGRHGTQIASTMNHSAHPQSAEARDEVMIDPDP